ncbi:hypothetical protein ACM64Y_08140 [Novispirillum sp. DQ9]|uniref:hypothetical protein n=1 Tax=Novispirillum sp. DQ9 TaxID=3398612 RepID=UPI003C7D639C
MILEAFAAQAALAKQAVSLHMAAGAARAVSIAIAAVFLLFALGFAAVALFFVLEQSMSPAAAALWVALLLVLLAGLAWMLGVLVARPRTRAARVAMTSAMAPLTAAGLAATRPAPPTAAGGVAPPPPSAHALMLDHGMAVGARAHAALAAHPVGLLAAGLGAGLLFGLSAGVRRGVRRLLPW